MNRSSFFFLNPAPAKRPLQADKMAAQWANLDREQAFDKGPLGRRFPDDPKLELICLLRGAAEIEHALICQYLYAYFSVKSQQYPNLANKMRDLFVGEMEHMKKVNNMLGLLGMPPAISRTELPFSSDIYPFDFSLESLTTHSIAKYCFAESPSSVAQSSGQNDIYSQRLLHAELRVNAPNHIDSIYTQIITLAGEAKRAGTISDRKHEIISDWAATIRDEGTQAHYSWLKDVLVGSKEIFPIKDPWILDADDPGFPSRNIPADPVLWAQPSTYTTEMALILAKIFNYNYWIVLALLDVYHRLGIEGKTNCGSLNVNRDLILNQASHNHMNICMWESGLLLAKNGFGPPFDQLPGGISFGDSIEERLMFVASLLKIVDPLNKQIIQAEVRVRWEEAIQETKSIVCKWIAEAAKCKC